MMRHRPAYRLRRWWAVLVGGLMPVAFSTGLRATGQNAGLLDAAAVRRKLEQGVSLAWDGVPLGEGIGGLCRERGLACLIDRRVDPNRRITVADENAPLKKLLDRIAEAGDLGVAMVGPVLYWGPKPTAEELPTVAAIARERIKKLDRRLQVKWLSPHAAGWSDFAEPRWLIKQLAKLAGAEVEGIAAVPHDLWARAELPRLSWCDQLTLIAAQFDLRFELSRDGRSIQLAAWPAAPTLERDYPGGRVPRARARQWKQRSPAAQIVVRGDRIVVRGTLADHERIFSSRGTARGERPGRHRAAAEKRYDLKVRGVPAKKLIETLAERLGWTIEFDPRIPARRLDGTISVEVHQVTAERLFRATLDAARLDLRREKRHVIITLPPQR